MAPKRSAGACQAPALMAIPVGPNYLAALRTAVRLRRESVM